MIKTRQTGRNQPVDGSGSMEVAADTPTGIAVSRIITTEKIAPTCMATVVDGMISVANSRTGMVLDIYTMSVKRLRF